MQDDMEFLLRRPSPHRRPCGLGQGADVAKRSASEAPGLSPRGPAKTLGRPTDRVSLQHKTMTPNQQPKPPQSSRAVARAGWPLVCQCLWWQRVRYGAPPQTRCALRSRRVPIPHPLRLVLVACQGSESRIPNLLTDCCERLLGMMVLGAFYFDAPHRTAGHVGLGWRSMSQSAARLRPPA